jgi:hypothetical protein
MSGLITDCLSGDVNKDFSQLYHRVAETTEVPQPLPYGMPLRREPVSAGAAGDRPRSPCLTNSK